MLAAGCTVVFKASEHSPRTHHFIAEVFAEAGLPAGALNVVQCRREDAAVLTETLIAHDAIRKVEFIGSPAVGKIIGQLGGKYLKPVLMELGGKCAAIVLDDARLEDAAKKCIEGGSLSNPSKKMILADGSHSVYASWTDLLLYGTDHNP
jgi:acyl-CoA reductase-like NAD-dependent aldehyde dehydrogenase